MKTLTYHLKFVFFVNSNVPFHPFVFVYRNCGQLINMLFILLKYSSQPVNILLSSSFDGNSVLRLGGSLRCLNFIFIVHGNIMVVKLRGCNWDLKAFRVGHGEFEVPQVFLDQV